MMVTSSAAVSVHGICDVIGDFCFLLSLLVTSRTVMCVGFCEWCTSVLAADEHICRQELVEFAVVG